MFITNQDYGSERDAIAKERLSSHASVVTDTQGTKTIWCDISYIEAMKWSDDMNPVLRRLSLGKDVRVPIVGGRYVATSS